MNILDTFLKACINSTFLTYTEIWPKMPKISKNGFPEFFERNLFVGGRFWLCQIQLHPTVNKIEQRGRCWRSTTKFSKLTVVVTYQIFRINRNILESMKLNEIRHKFFVLFLLFSTHEIRSGQIKKLCFQNICL